MSVLPAVAESPVEADDARLCRLAARGDDAAFAELCRRHARPLLMMARGMGLNDADASDVTQEALCRVLEKRHFLASVRSVRAWLYRVALNLARSRARQTSRQARVLVDRAWDVPIPSAPEAAAPSPSVDWPKALEVLSPTQREVVTLRLSGLSHAEVGRVLRVSEGASKVHFHHAVQRLRQKLGGHHDG